MWEENQKIIEYRYYEWKNLPTWTKTEKEKPEDESMKNLLIQLGSKEENQS